GGGELGQGFADEVELHLPTMWGGLRRSLRVGAIVHVIRPAASSTACKFFVYPVHRHRLLARASRISSRVGRGFSSSSDLAASRMPGVQYPHCAAPSSANATWSGCRSEPFAIPSIVVIARPSS